MDASRLKFGGTAVLVLRKYGGFSLSAFVALCFFFVWALAPVCCCFAVSLLRRNANLAGGFAGRPCLSFFLVWSVYCHCHAFLYSLDIVFVLIRVVYVYPAFRTEPLSFIGRTWEKTVYLLQVKHVLTMFGL